MYSLKFLALFIDFAGSIVIGAASVLILVKYFLNAYNIKQISKLHFNFANILVFSLTVKSGAALINSMLVGSWQQFFWFLVILGLRFMLGKALQWEKHNFS